MVQKNRNFIFTMLIGVLGMGILLFVISFDGNAAPLNQQPASGRGTEFDKLVGQLQQNTNNEVRISYHAQTDLVRFIGGSADNPVYRPAALSPNATPEVLARGFLDEYGLLFGLQDQSVELQIKKDRTLDDGRSFVRFQQVFQGVPILAGELIVQISTERNIVSANGEILPNLSLSTIPGIDGATAQQIALESVSQNHGLSVNELEATDPELWIYNPILIGGPGAPENRLIWRLEVNAMDASLIRELVLVDAQTGAILLRLNQVETALNREIFDGLNNRDVGLPGIGPLRREGDLATDDNDVDLAYDYSGDTYNFYLDEHNRDSVDDAGMQLISTVRYCNSSPFCPISNAYWNFQQMIYGQGWAAADDIVAHELTHGVTEFTSELIYAYESGAINESFSDAWGEFVDLSNDAGNDNANVRWQIGENLPVWILRDMEYPPAIDQPDRMSSSLYHCNGDGPPNDFNDHGGVHTNSGVNNKAAFLMTDGGTFNGYPVYGMGISTVADLYYEVQTNLLTSGASYVDLYSALIQACHNLNYGANQCQNVTYAIAAVEMYREPVYVSLNPPHAGNASCAEGVRTINSGVEAVPDHGIIWIHSGSYDEDVVIDRPMLLQSTGGTVTIGQ